MIESGDNNGKRYTSDYNNKIKSNNGLSHRASLQDKTPGEFFSNKNSNSKIKTVSNLNGNGNWNGNGNLNGNKNGNGNGLGIFNPNNYKTKSDFQKKLMGESNLNKYKNICIGLLKEDDQLKKLCEFCGFLPNFFECLLEEQFFSDKVFLYKLEVLLSTDTNLSKIKKEKFFREEIKDKLEFLSYDIKYKQKINKMNSMHDNHLINIQNFDFFK
jgi:hypothetical protein